MTRISDIITMKNLDKSIRFEVNYPGHIDLLIGETPKDGQFLVLTADAANELCTQLQDCVKTAYERAEREKPLFSDEHKEGT